MWILLLKYLSSYTTNLPNLSIPGELRALYAAQGDSFGDREWNALWGADFGIKG